MFQPAATPTDPAQPFLAAQTMRWWMFTPANAIATCGLLAMLLAMPRPTLAGEYHPQDGPHVDIRILIDDERVTFNLMMNLVFVDAIADVPRENPDLVHEVELSSMREAIFEVLSRENRVTIDGAVLTPEMKNFERLEPDVSLLPLFPLSGIRGLSTVRMALEYPVESSPQRVAMVWGLYPVDPFFTTPEETVLLDMAAELSAEGITTNFYFTHDEPEFTWHATGATIDDRMLAIPRPAEPEVWRIPVISIGLLALLAALFTGLRVSSVWSTVRKPFLAIVSPLALVAAVLLIGIGQVEMRNPWQRVIHLTEVEALAIFRPLHTNVYRAFDYTTESDIYDALSRSVDGRLLDNLYNQIYRSLILYEEGGAMSRVEAVTPIHYEIGNIGVVEQFDGAFGFRVLANWEVLGRVYHWGHSHSRLNQYLAEYTVIETDSGWRIADNRVIEQYRVNLDLVDSAGQSSELPATPSDVEL